jgi:hypothetical protein
MAVLAGRAAPRNWAAYAASITTCSVPRCRARPRCSPGSRKLDRAANSVRRIFNDPEGLAAGRNLRSYLIQSYARDMGGGKNVMLKEISVPIRVNGRHWGCFRTVWTPHRRGAATS